MDLGGDRDLTLFVFVVDALPYVRYIQLLYDVGADALTRWLRRQPPEVAQADRAMFEDHAAAIEAVIQHIVSAWWRLDQIGARRGPC